MSHCMIYRLTMLIQDIVSEVVILVNDEIGFDVVCLKFLMNIVHTVACRFLLLVFNNIAFGIILGIARNEITIHHIEIPIDILFNSILVASWLREVKPQHLVFITLWGRMASHVCVSKQKVKFVLGLDVIIRLHHRQEETLAEATRTDEEKKVPRPLHTFEIHGLVNHILTLALNLRIIRNAIRQQLVLPHNLTFSFG